MEELLKKIVEENRVFYREGRVADYIPALKNADLKDCGITVIDKSKEIYSVGDSNKNFTIQSISKVISLMLAILDNGTERVFQTVGYEGTERPFNDISYLGDDNTNIAINPMLNSGAIAVTSLINGNGEKRIARILELTRLLACNQNIEIDKEVYRSEKNTGDRNKSIAYLMKSKGIIKGDADDILDTYFKQCSISINTVDLANIGFSIANRFKDIELESNINKKELSSLLIAMMVHSGMYNSSGRWSVEVGLPSKSGVAGGILSLVPDKYGIGFYGPGLDVNSNSHLGHRILKDLSRELDLKIY